MRRGTWEPDPRLLWWGSPTNADHAFRMVPGRCPSPHPTFLSLALLTAISLPLWCAEGRCQTVLECRFDGSFEDVSGIAPRKAEGVKFAPGREGGQAAWFDRLNVLTYPTKGFNPHAFTILFWIKYDKPLRDYRFQQHTYFYHETLNPNDKPPSNKLQNRIAIYKRSGFEYFIFAMSDGKGEARGNSFGGTWFAMKTKDFDWPANTWHHFVATADKSQGKAQLFIDGEQVAEAKGTEFPEHLGEVFWIGCRNRVGKMPGIETESCMRGLIDDLKIESVSALK